MTLIGRNAPCPCGSSKKYKRCCGATLQPVAEEAPRVIKMPEREIKNAPGLLVLLPSRGRPTIETLMAMGHTDSLPTLVVPCARKGIVDARNELAKAALRIPPKAPWAPKFGWYCLWVDDDAFWMPRTILRMMKGLAIPGVDILGGWFTGRAPRQAPKAYRYDGSWPKPGVEGDCEDGDVVEVARMGFHFVMHKVEVLEKLGANPFTPKGTNEPGEDLAFCARARDAGLGLYVHTGCPVAHIDDDGTAYLPGEGPMAVDGAELKRIDSNRTYEGLGPEQQTA